jgi:tetratricopeptide (TPR) repeat protein
MPLSRLKDSRLVRTAGVYAGVSWVVLQVIDTLGDNLGLPPSLFVATLVLLSVGFVVVLATAWVQARPGLAERARAEEVPEAWEFDGGDLLRSLARGKLPHLTWARALGGGVAAFLLLFGFAGLYVVVQDGGESFLVSSAEASAPPGVAVMPFAVSGPGVDLLREGMMDLLSTNLDGVGGLRTIHTRTVLARWREGGLENEAGLDEVLEIARATGARLALVGSAVGVGSTVRLRAELYNLDNGNEVGEAQIEGPQEDLLALLDQLSVDVVRRVLQEEGGSSVQVRSLESLTTSSLPALRAFLEGEALYRRADFEGASLAFQRAVEGDSLFALAHHRLGTVLGWTILDAGERGDRHAQIARELADRLPTRDATIIRLSNRAMREGERSAVEEFREFAAQHPDDPEVWYWLGEVYNHAGEVALVPVEDMGAAFESAIALDSAFVPAYIHAIESALSFHDMDTARALVAGFERYGPGVADLDRMRFMLRFAQSTEGIDEALAEASDESVANLAINIDDANVGTDRMRGDVVEELLSRVDGGRALLSEQFALILAADARLSLGRHNAFLALLPRLDPVNRAILQLQAGFQGVTVVNQEALETDGALAALVFAALMTARAGDRAGYEASRQEIRTMALPDGADADAFAAQRARFTQVVEAWGLWAFEGAEAGAPALDAAHEANAEGGAAIVSQLLALAAEAAHTELGRWEEALRYARSARADPFATLRQAELYERLGRVDEARRLYSIALHALADADPGVPEVTRARERMAALRGG